MSREESTGVSPRHFLYFGILWAVVSTFAAYFGNGITWVPGFIAIFVSVLWYLFERDFQANTPVAKSDVEKPRNDNELE